MGNYFSKWKSNSSNIWRKPWHRKKIGILNNSLDEFREISKNNHVVPQMDNCRVHWSLEVLQIYKNNEITVIDWPPYSQDLNRIENVWVFIKAKLG